MAFKTEVMSRLLNLLIALDQFLFCCCTLGGSDPDETASSAAWRLEQQGRWQGRLFRPLIDALFFFDPAHCASAYLAEVRRAQSKTLEL